MFLWLRAKPPIKKPQFFFFTFFFNIYLNKKKIHKFYLYFKSVYFSTSGAYILTWASHRINVLKALVGINWGHKRKPYSSPVCPLPSPFSFMQLPFSSPTPHHLSSRNSTTSIDLQEETKMLPLQDHLSLISSKYLARPLQHKNLSQSVVTSPSGIRNMK